MAKAMMFQGDIPEEQRMIHSKPKSRKNPAALNCLRDMFMFAKIRLSGSTRQFCIVALRFLLTITRIFIFT